MRPCYTGVLHRLRPSVLPLYNGGIQELSVFRNRGSDAAGGAKMRTELFLICESHDLPYGLALLTGALLSLGLGGRRAMKAGRKTRDVALATLLLPLLGAFFAHLFYCLARLNYVIHEYPPLYVLAFWEKGHMLYGGAAGCLLACFLAGGRKGAARLMDAYAPSGALMIAAVRVAEGFSGQGYGEYFLEESPLCRFPFMMYDPYYEMWAWALFVLEALIALALFVLLLRIKEGRPGDKTLVLLGLYAAAQILLESLRRDDFLRWGFVRCAQVFSAVAVLAVLLCYQLSAPKGRTRSKALCWATAGAMLLCCLLLEFAVEGRVPFLRFLSPEGCYALMAAACGLLMGCVLRMRRLAR